MAELLVREADLHRHLDHRRLRDAQASLPQSRVDLTRDLEEENKILRRAAAAVEQVVPPKERFRLVDELAADGVRVRRACYFPGRVHVRLP